MNYYDFVSQPSFFSFLLEIDRSIAEQAHARPCSFCTGKLSRGDFFRSGLGLPAGCDEEHQRRFSFCCQVDGCRKRSTPESVRFLRGFAYVTIIVLVMSAIHHGLSAARVRDLTTKLRVSRQPVARWLVWWRKHFAGSAFWRVQRGRFMPTLDETKLPLALLEHFETAGDQLRDGVVLLLRWLAQCSDASPR